MTLLMYSIKHILMCRTTVQLYESGFDCRQQCRSKHLLTGHPSASWTKSLLKERPKLRDDNDRVLRIIEI